VRIYVPDHLFSEVISLVHYNPESGQIGPLRTAQLVSEDFFWPAMNATVRKYVAGYEVCNSTKAPRLARRETNIAL
jgi:hypothetical protein